MEKEEFLKILPKLIREDDEVKGAIITALSGVVATKEDIARIIEHSDKRFEAMDNRFKTIQEQMDKRFEAMDNRFKTIQEQMDNRFELLIEQMNTGFEEARKERKLIDAKIDSIGRRSGEALENTILYLLKERLIQENIQSSSIKKEILIDKEGTVFWKNYSTDIDILIQNGKTILIEIKYYADNRDIFHLKKNAELYKTLLNKEYDELMFICLEINEVNLHQAEQQGVKVIAGSIIH